MIRSLFANKGSVNVIAQIRDDGQRYVYLYDDAEASRHELYRELKRQGLDQELSITVREARDLSWRVYRAFCERCGVPQ